MRFKYCNPITEEYGVLVLQRLLHNIWPHYCLQNIKHTVVIWGEKAGSRQLLLILVIKSDGVTIKSHISLIQLLQTEQSEPVRYPGSSGLLPSVSQYIYAWFVFFPLT